MTSDLSTRARVGQRDQDRYSGEVASLRANLTDATADDARIWEVYSGTEKLIAILKFRLDYETPGVFTKLPDPSEPSRLIADASRLFERSQGLIAKGEFAEAIETLRSARNNLRSILTEKRRSSRRK